MKNRIREVRKLKGLTLVEVADKAHTTPQHLSRLEKKENIDTKWLEVLAEIFEVKTSDLFSLDAGAPHIHKSRVLQLSDSGPHNPAFTAADNIISYSIPIIAWEDIYGYLNGRDVDVSGDAITDHEVSEKAFAVAIIDSDMEPRFIIGDLLIVDPDRRVLSGGFCLLDPVRNGKIICRKFVETPQMYIFSTLKPDVLDLTSPLTGYETLPIVGAVLEMKPKLY